MAQWSPRNPRWSSDDHTVIDTRHRPGHAVVWKPRPYRGRAQSRSGRMSPHFGVKGTAIRYSSAVSLSAQVALWPPNPSEFQPTTGFFDCAKVFPMDDRRYSTHVDSRPPVGWERDTLV